MEYDMKTRGNQETVLVEDCIFNAQPFLSPIAFNLLMRLKLHSDDLISQVSNQELQLLCNISKNTVTKALKELTDESIISIQYNSQEASNYEIDIKHLEVFVIKNEILKKNLLDKATYRKRRINQVLRKEVFERDLYRCIACSTHLDLTLDHKIPESLGGQDTFENLQTMCRSCNSSKGALTMDEWTGRAK